VDARTPDRGEVVPRSAYGLNWRGLSDECELLSDARPTSVEVEVERCASALAHDPVVDHERATFEGPTATFDLRRVPLRLMVHERLGFTELDLLLPGLARAAAVVHAWAGREVFQGGAVATAGGTIAVLGPRGAGKSTLLAGCLRAGAEVIADEIVVIGNDGTVAVGPRALVVRDDVAELVEADAPRAVAPAGWSGTGRLVRLGGAPVFGPLVGWVVLSWGEACELRPLRGSERMVELGARRLHGDLQRSSSSFLELASLPAWRLTRPPTRQALLATAELLTTGPGGQDWP
jgi:hypothetical protein